MKIIIAMAGEGSRFKNIGIHYPKHEIIVGGKTLFEWSMLSLNDFFDEEFIFITRTGQYSADFIEQKCSELGVNKYKICEIEKLTDGQATTVMQADSLIPDDESVLIYNIDTYVKEGSILKSQIDGDCCGFIPVFNAEGDKWSFIRLDENGVIVEVAEKKRISQWGSIGLYYFSLWKEYKNIYHTLKNEINSQFKETYIAPMYQYFIREKKKIGFSIINESDVHVLGTPEDVEIFKKKMNY